MAALAHPVSHWLPKMAASTDVRAASRIGGLDKVLYRYTDCAIIRRSQQEKIAWTPP